MVIPDTFRLGLALTKCPYSISWWRVPVMQQWDQRTCGCGIIQLPTTNRKVFCIWMNLNYQQKSNYSAVVLVGNTHPEWGIARDAQGGLGRVKDCGSRLRPAKLYALFRASKATCDLWIVDVLFPRGIYSPNNVVYTYK